MITCMFINAKVCPSNLVKSGFSICIFNWRLAKVLPLVWIKKQFASQRHREQMFKADITRIK